MSECILGAPKNTENLEGSKPLTYSTHPRPRHLVAILSTNRALRSPSCPQTPPEEPTHKVIQTQKGSLTPVSHSSLEISSSKLGTTNIAKPPALAGAPLHLYVSLSGYIDTWDGLGDRAKVFHPHTEVGEVRVRESAVDNVRSVLRDGMLLA